ncbi:SRPBCC family protein [Epibacterium ulvae]|uniref:SRPBCC family protein n=1 Tax=Epibacterium ulvae TaxID=1156985 RepID=UPI001BFC4D08|nr:SRPBCC family protein [Epibacterium ulvae]MBT8154203.1 SRPBCC family protein [Epibacterium ulvae]
MRRVMFHWKHRIWLAVTAAIMAVVAFLGAGPLGQTMELYEHATISGELDDVWRVATDVAGWPQWDPHEEAGEIYGPFVAGTTAFSKPRGGPAAHWELIEVTEHQSWSLINTMRIGTLEVDNRYTQLPDGQVKCEKIMRVSGWILTTLFKLHFEAATRKDMQATWAALEREIG